jgi:hypothetical protein
MHPCFTPVIHYLMKDLFMIKRREISNLKLEIGVKGAVYLLSLMVEPSPYGDYRSCSVGAFSQAG